jgi:hypothetical protein
MSLVLFLLVFFFFPIHQKSAIQHDGEIQLHQIQNQIGLYHKQIKKTLTNLAELDVIQSYTASNPAIVSYLEAPISQIDMYLRSTPLLEGILLLDPIGNTLISHPFYRTSESIMGSDYVTRATDGIFQLFDLYSTIKISVYNEFNEVGGYLIGYYSASQLEKIILKPLHIDHVAFVGGNMYCYEDHRATTPFGYEHIQSTQRSTLKPSNIDIVFFNMETMPVTNNLVFWIVVLNCVYIVLLVVVLYNNTASKRQIHLNTAIDPNT